MNYCPLEEAWGNQFQEIDRYKNEQPVGQLSNFTQHHNGEFNSQDSDDESETYSAKFTRKLLSICMFLKLRTLYPRHHLLHPIAN